MSYINPSTGRPREAHGGGPPEGEPERRSYQFGELLIGAKFWFEGEQYLKVAVDMARRRVDHGTLYEVFKDDEIVEGPFT